MTTDKLKSLLTFNEALELFKGLVDEYTYEEFLDCINFYAYDDIEKKYYKDPADLLIHAFDWDLDAETNWELVCESIEVQLNTSYYADLKNKILNSKVIVKEDGDYEG